MAKDRWCKNCGQHVSPQRGKSKEAGCFGVLGLLLFLAAIGTYQKVGESATFWTVDGLAIFILLLAIVAEVSSSKRRCPICRSSNWGRGP
jgi:hypothetical protein